MEGLQLLKPEICLAACALALMAADLGLRGRQGRLLYWFGAAAALLTIGFVAVAHSNPGPNLGPGSLWIADRMGLFFKDIVLAASALVLLLSLDYSGGEQGHPGTFAALVLFSALGMCLLVMASDLLLVFLSLELISIASFVLVGFERKDLKASEGAMKYFLIGAFSSAIMVYGISLYYGATGTTRLTALPSFLTMGSSPIFTLAVLFLLVGFGFKVSMVPFHLWVPDAYEGAPTPVTAFLSIAPKVAGLAAMARIFVQLIPHGNLDLSFVFAAFAMATMLVGNLTAIFQTNIKRLLAYSSIAQAGYMLIGLTTADALGLKGLMIYSLVYLFMNLGAFAVAIAVGNEGGYELEAYDGLAKRNLGLALLMSFFLLSLAGIPPLAGFIGKFYLFAAAIQKEFYALAVVAVLTSVVSVYYYMRVAYHMFFREPRTLEPLPTGLLLHVGLTVAAVGVFALGLYPEPFLVLVEESALALPSAGGLLASTASAGLPVP